MKNLRSEMENVAIRCFRSDMINHVETEIEKLGNSKFNSLNDEIMKVFKRSRKIKTFNFKFNAKYSRKFLLELYKICISKKLFYYASIVSVTGICVVGCEKTKNSIFADIHCFRSYKTKINYYNFDEEDFDNRYHDYLYDIKYAKNCIFRKYDIKSYYEEKMKFEYMIAKFYYPQLPEIKIFTFGDYVTFANSYEESFLRQCSSEINNEKCKFIYFFIKEIIRYKTISEYNAYINLPIERMLEREFFSLYSSDVRLNRFVNHLTAKSVENQADF